MLSYTIANIPRAEYAPLFLAQASIPSLKKPTLLPKPIVNIGLVALGLTLSTLGFYHKNTDLGVISMGAGSSIVGAGVVLLILDIAGFDSSDTA